MVSVKTAISIDRPTFEQMERLARRFRVSRSRLFSLAAEEFVRRHRGRELTEQINRALEKGRSADDKPLRDAMSESFRRLVEGTW